MVLDRVNRRQEAGKAVIFKVRQKPARYGLFAIGLVWILAIVPLSALAAPYAAMVMDARTGEVLHDTNADARLHPASLTKMMTLYIAFQAIERGEISLDTPVRISANAASEPPSKLGLRAGQSIKLRYLIRAAAVKSANDAATAIGEAISGSEAAFATRMTRTARAMGMTKTTFKNAHGLTADGHLSSARDMTILGRHLIYDHPEYYNLFQRRTADAGMGTVSNTNRKLLDSYPGADGIKTGYTRAAGYNLVASAERGRERVIATVFGGRSGAARNAKVAELLDLGFRRAPAKAPLDRPAPPVAMADVGVAAAPQAKAAQTIGPKGKTIRLTGAVKTSLRPQLRPGTAPARDTPPAPVLATLQDDIQNALEQVVTADAQPAPVAGDTENDMATNTASAAASDTENAAGNGAGAAMGRDPTTAAPATSVRPPDIIPVIAAKAMADADTAASADDPAFLASDSDTASAGMPDAAPAPTPVLAAITAPPLRPRARVAPQPAVQETVSRVSTSGGRHWGITVGKFPNRYLAERALLKTALAESASLDGSLRKVVERKTGFEAAFLGMTRDGADLACRRLQARKQTCFMVGPS